MLRKEKSESQHLSPSDNQPVRPTRKSFPGIAAPDNSSLSTGQPPRRKKSADKRKVSRVHLGRMQFLSEDLVEDDVSGMTLLIIAMRPLLNRLSAKFRFNALRLKILSLLDKFFQKTEKRKALRMNDPALTSLNSSSEVIWQMTGSHFYVMYPAPAEPCFFLAKRGFIYAILLSDAVDWNAA